MTAVPVLMLFVMAGAAADPGVFPDSPPGNFDDATIDLGVVLVDEPNASVASVEPATTQPVHARPRREKDDQAPTQNITAAAQEPVALRGSTARRRLAEAAEGRQDAGAAGDVDHSVEEAMLYVKSRLTRAKNEESSLRRQLYEALRWGRDLQGQVAASRKFMAVEKRRIRQVFVRKIEETNAALARERRHERSLEKGLQNATHVLLARNQRLWRAHLEMTQANQSYEAAEVAWKATEAALRTKEAGEAQQVQDLQAALRDARSAKALDDAQLKSVRAELSAGLQAARERIQREKEAVEQRTEDVLAKEHHRERFLEQNLKNASYSLSTQSRVLAQVRQQLSEKTRTLEEEEKAWQAKEAQLKRDQAVQVKDEEARLESLRAAKASEDDELKTTRDQRVAELKAVHTVMLKAREREEELRAAVIKERTEATEREKALRHQAEHQKLRAEQEIEAEGALRKEVSQLQNFSQKELTSLMSQLGAAKRYQDDILAQRDNFAQELRVKTSQVLNLTGEVTTLRHRVEEDASARQVAEDRARKAEAEMASAQAVAKQLSGTVPQLLEQAQLAHEAQDAEKAMRAQAQAQANREIQRLEEQYTTLVQGQIDQLAPPVMKGANDTSPLVSGIDEDAMATVSLPGASKEELTDTVDLPPLEVPDLASDSHGLKQLLSKDSPAEDRDGEDGNT